ncbi:MAG: helix-turn-helix transcriptional regulator [Saprospiraceae bacterium]|nr:helix-turn-helix transcriptional regulator [Saprospiraceae bacterium]
MAEKTLHVRSISQVHELLGMPKPKHPLISLIDVSQMAIPEQYVGVKIQAEFYQVSLKDKSCGVEYGRNSFDFDEGVMVFSAPRQVSTFTETIEKGNITGWMLIFHPDLIRGTHLGDTIDDFSFFDYGVFEALHLSDEEEDTVSVVVKNIQQEYEQRIDNHSQRVIISNLELLLSYCLRFYERQFNTRTAANKDVVADFEKELKGYFEKELQLEHGTPSIAYFAEKAHLSQHYFSDLLKKETGRSAKDHINDFLVEKAKHLLLSDNRSVSEIAYDLGFNYPHYFTRLFKSKTGVTPVSFRNLN